MHSTTGLQLVFLPLSPNLGLLKELTAAQHIIGQGIDTGLDGSPTGLQGMGTNMELPLLTTHTNLPAGSTLQGQPSC